MTQLSAILDDAVGILEGALDDLHLAGLDGEPVATEAKRVLDYVAAVARKLRSIEGFLDEDSIELRMDRSVNVDSEVVRAIRRAMQR